MADPNRNKLLLAALGVAGLLLERRKTTAPAPHRAPKPSKPAPRSTGQAVPSATNAPSDPPRRAWWPVLKRVGLLVSQNNLMTQAAAITFYALLSIFPAMAALVSIFGLVADPGTIVKQMDSLSGVLPGGGQSLLTDELRSLTASSNGGLGWGLAIGLATSFWTSNQAMKALFGALNAVHEVPEQRSFVKLTAITLAATIGSILFVVVALFGIVVVPAALALFGLGGIGDKLISLARWPILLLCITLLLALLYRFGPSRVRVAWRWVTAGSAAASVLWIVVSVLFSWYVANFGNYNRTYGSLGAVVGFMTWIWISSTVILIGAQLDAVMAKAEPGEGKPVDPS